MQFGTPRSGPKRYVSNVFWLKNNIFSKPPRPSPTLWEQNIRKLSVGTHLERWDGYLKFIRNPKWRWLCRQFRVQRKVADPTVKSGGCSNFYLCTV